MLKKRIVFTLLYQHGFFYLSRNFRLQKVGDLSWLIKNYQIEHISFFLDELILLNVGPGDSDSDQFCRDLVELSGYCFMPISVGGGIRSLDYARRLFLSGADKVVINTPIFSDINFVFTLVSEFGRQAIVGSLDIKKDASGTYQVWSHSGKKLAHESAEIFLASLNKNLFGEILLNSIDRDGTGTGYEMEMLEILPNGFDLPLILSGGAGNAAHLSSALLDSRIDAVATANLFNFVGNGFKNARNQINRKKVVVASWPALEELQLSRRPSDHD